MKKGNDVDRYQRVFYSILFIWQTVSDMHFYMWRSDRSIDRWEKYIHPHRHEIEAQNPGESYQVSINMAS